MEEVHNRETQLLVHRDDFSKENDRDVTTDIKEQCKNHEIDLNIHEATQSKQNLILEGLNQKQQTALKEMKKQHKKLEDENKQLVDEEADL